MTGTRKRTMDVTLTAMTGYQAGLTGQDAADGSAFQDLPAPVRVFFAEVGVEDTSTEDDLICPFCEEPLFEFADILGHDLVGSVCCYAMQDAALAWGLWETSKDRRAFTEVACPGAGINAVGGEQGNVWTLSFPLTTQRARQDEAFAFIDEYHRHHDPPTGWLLGIDVFNGPTKVGTAVLSRCVSRMLMHAGTHFEVSRIYIRSDVPDVLKHNAVSVLTRRLRKEARHLARAARSCLRRGRNAKGWLLSPDEWAMCLRRSTVRYLRTYILEHEAGVSLQASGWRLVGVTRSSVQGWSRSRRRRKLRWVDLFDKHQYDIAV